MYNLINVWVTFATRINRYYILVITIPWGLKALLTSAPVTVLLAPNSHLHQKASNLAFNQAKSVCLLQLGMPRCLHTIHCLFPPPSCLSIFTLSLSTSFLLIHIYCLFVLPSCSSISTLSTSFLLIHIHSVFLYFLLIHNPYPLFPLPSYSSIFTLSTSFLLIHIHCYFVLPAHPDPLFPLPTHPYLLFPLPSYSSIVFPANSSAVSLQQHIPSHTKPQVFKSLPPPKRSSIFNCHLLPPQLYYLTFAHIQCCHS